MATDETVEAATYKEWWMVWTTTYYLFTWGTHYLSGYYQSHENKNIMGVYPTMSAELIIDPEHPDQAHHLVGYWNTSRATKTHHYMFEALSNITTQPSTPFSAYSGYAKVSGLGENAVQAVENLSFYEYESIEVRTSNSSGQQNPPAFANQVYRYGCYSGDDVYFFYTYTDYTITYHENNANLTTGTEAGIRTETFHYVDGILLADQLTAAGFDYDYEPDRPYVSSYGNAYLFGGWYLDAECENTPLIGNNLEGVYENQWETLAPTTNLDLYAKWIAPTFTITLIVPEGTLYDDTLKQFDQAGYTWTSSVEGTTTTYVVSNIPGATPADKIVQERRGAQSSLSLAFDYWGYMVNGEEQRYLFDESQLVVSDLTLTARWKTEYTGQYTVRYLTAEPQENGLGTVDVDGVPYYRLLGDRVVTGLAVGSTFTEEAQPVSGYLSREGALSAVVEMPREGESVTEFNFFYDKIAHEVTYTVHYVLDSGTDYGRSPPAADAVLLAADKTVTVPAANLNQSTMVRENALVVGGYSPRDGWTASFNLSGDSAENHLYIYYTPNTYTVEFQATYHFADAEGNYTATDAVELTYHLDAALGKVLTAQELTENYQSYLEGDNLEDLEAAMAGHTLDTVLTEPYLLLTQTDNVYHIYLRNGAYTLTYHLNGSGEFPTSWTDADSFLTPGTDGTYAQTVTYPQAADVPRTQPSRQAYTFVGWSTGADGSGTVYPAGDSEFRPVVSDGRAQGEYPPVCPVGSAAGRHI